MMKKLKNKKGFSLIEVITAVLIFAILASFLAGVIQVAMNMSTRATRTNKSHLSASNGMEKRVSDDLASVPSGVVVEDGVTIEFSFVRR